jgi:hypothetical protein
MEPHAHDHAAVKRGVRLAVTATVEAMPSGAAHQSSDAFCGHTARRDPSVPGSVKK